MKKSSAFTFAEVLIALVILAVSMTILSNLQIKSVFRVFKGREQIERIFLIKKELYKMLSSTPSEQDKPLKQKLEQPEMMLISQRKQIVPKSSLKDFSKEVHIITTQGKWKSGPSDRSMSMVSFVLRNRQKKDE